MTLFHLDIIDHRTPLRKGVSNVFESFFKSMGSAVTQQAKFNYYSYMIDSNVAFDSIVIPIRQLLNPSEDRLDQVNDSR